MIQENTTSCPVDLTTVNEYKVRLIALQVFILGTVILIVPHVTWIALLTLDFSTRSFNLNKFSPLAFISAGIIRLFSIGNKPVNQGPKRFAAHIGLIFSTAILLSYYTQYPVATTILTSILVVFACLESFFSFCAGCYAYTVYQRLLRTAQSWKQ